ncbi:hypothetical protein [Embleya hyalina]|nr:hypothetical protein [Embleya hyalina]
MAARARIIREDTGKGVDALRRNVVNHDDMEGRIAAGSRVPA